MAEKTIWFVFSIVLAVVLWWFVDKGVQ